jgi:hypothetical protein
MVASSLFKSRVFNPIHLNQVAEEYNGDKGEMYDVEDGTSYLAMKNDQKRHLKKNDQNLCGKKNQPHKDSNPSAALTHPRIHSTGKITRKASVAARTKDLRLKGADLYVARLGSECECKHIISPPLDLLDPSLSANLPKPPAPVATRSLHDELLHSTPSRPPPTIKVTSPPAAPQVRASHPCYRCVTHMYAVGIKRVFWTNAQGEWDVAKVRDLMDALETSGSGSGDSSGDGGRNLGVFVTKHEVLMLKRVMGC